MNNRFCVPSTLISGEHIKTFGVAQTSNHLVLMFKRARFRNY